jgi:hypothetical protein
VVGRARSSKRKRPNRAIDQDPLAASAQPWRLVVASRP